MMGPRVLPSGRISLPGSHRGRARLGWRGRQPSLDAWLMLSEPGRRRKLETQFVSKLLRDLELPQSYRLATSSADFGERPSSVNSSGVKISIKSTPV